jgi:hypothetical protein
MKRHIKYITFAVTLMLTGCGTIMRSHVGNMSDQELQLRRYQLALKTGSATWRSGDAYEDWDEDMREKEYVERELLHRGLINPANSPQMIAPIPQVIYGNPTLNIL